MPSGTAATIDDETFTALLHRATPQLQAFVRRLAGNDADRDDVLQESLARAWRLRHSFDPRLDAKQNGSAWLQRLAFRVFCDHRARGQRQPAASDGLQGQPAPEAPCRTELRDEVMHRLSGLPEIERTLLLGFHASELSLRQLSKRHGLPINTVKSHLHRARQRLRSQQRSAAHPTSHQENS